MQRNQKQPLTVAVARLTWKGVQGTPEAFRDELAKEGYIVGKTQVSRALRAAQSLNHAWMKRERVGRTFRYFFDSKSNPLAA